MDDGCLLYPIQTRKIVQTASRSLFRWPKVISNSFQRESSVPMKGPEWSMIAPVGEVDAVVTQNSTFSSHLSTENPSVSPTQIVKNQGSNFMIYLPSLPSPFDGDLTMLRFKFDV